MSCSLSQCEPSGVQLAPLVRVGLVRLSGRADGGRGWRIAIGRGDAVGCGLGSRWPVDELQDERPSGDDACVASLVAELEQHCSVAHRFLSAGSRDRRCSVREVSSKLAPAHRQSTDLEDTALTTGLRTDDSDLRQVNGRAGQADAGEGVLQPASQRLSISNSRDGHGGRLGRRALLLTC
jgi:hypothetical protein